MGLSEEDKVEIISRYSARHQKYGYSPKTLGWDKGKQEVRFEMLTSLFGALENRSIIDVGCGFGDLRRFLAGVKNLSYTGIDLVPSLIADARAKHSDFTPVPVYLTEDFLSDTFQTSADFIVGSGIFNHKLSHDDNRAIIKKTLNKALHSCHEAIAFDFLSTRVDFRHEHTFHSDPVEILELAYSLSRNVALLSHYMPFEFTLVIFRDDTFTQDTMFRRFVKPERR